MSTDPFANNSLPASDPPTLAAVVEPPTEPLSAGETAGRFTVGGVLDRFLALKQVLRLKPYDTSTEAGRSQERYRRAALTTFTSVVARGAMVLSTLVAVRLTVRYLGTERYGLWMTITSIVGMMSFADLGIGSGLLNAISEAHGRNDQLSVHKYVSSAFFVLLGIATILVGAFAIAYPSAPWPRVFNVTSATAMREAGPAVFVFWVFFALNIPLDVVQRVQTGYQEGFETNLWNAAGSLMGLCCLLVAMHFEVGLPWLLLSLSSGQLLGIFGNWSHEFIWVRPWLLPGPRFWDWAAARKILSTGVMFLILNISAVFTAPVDNIIISQILGPAAVTQYAVPMRLFLIVVSVSLMFVLPLWPAYGEAMARGDVQWVRVTLINSLRYSMIVFAPVALGLALFGKVIVHIWVGPQIQPSYALLVGMATWTVIAIFGNAVATFFNGTNHLKVQVLSAAIMAIANLVLKLIFTRHFGLWAIPWATVLSSVISLLPQVWYAHRLLTRPGVFSRELTEAL